MYRASPAALLSPSSFPPAEVPLGSQYCPSPACLIFSLISYLFFVCAYNASPSAGALRILPVALPVPGSAAVCASLDPVFACAAATVAAAPANASASGYRRESAFLGSIIAAAAAEPWVMLQHFIASSTVLFVLLLLRSCMLRHLLLPAATPSSRPTSLFFWTGPASAAAVPAFVLRLFFISAVAVATVIKDDDHYCCRRPLPPALAPSPSPLLAAPVSASFSAPLSPVLFSGSSVAAVSPHSFAASLRLGSASSTRCLLLPAAAAVSSRCITQRLYPVVRPCAIPLASPLRAAVLASPSGFAVYCGSSSFSAAVKSSTCAAAAAASCDIADPLPSESTSLLRSVLPLTAAAAALSTSLLVAACRNGAAAPPPRLTGAALSDAALSSGAVPMCAATATLFAKAPAFRFPADAAGGHSTAAAAVFPTTAAHVCAAAAGTTRCAAAAAARSRPVAAANSPLAAVGASVFAAVGLPTSAAAGVSTVSYDGVAHSSEGWLRGCVRRRAAGPHSSSSSTPQQTPRRSHLRRWVATATPLHQAGAELAAAVAAANPTTVKTHSILHAAAEAFLGDLLPRLPQASLETSTGKGSSTWWTTRATAALEQKPVQQCLHYHPSCCLPDCLSFFPAEIIHSHRSHPLCSKRRLCSAPAPAVGPVPAVTAAAAVLPALPVAAALGGAGALSAAAVPARAGVPRRAASPARAIPARPAVAGARAVDAAARVLLDVALAAVAALQSERTSSGLAAGCCSLLRRESYLSLEKKQLSVHSSSRRQYIIHPLCCVSNRQAPFRSSTTARRNDESTKASFVGSHCTYIRSRPLVCCCCCSSRFRVASSSRKTGCSNKREVREEKAGKITSSCTFGWRSSDCCFLRDHNSSGYSSSCSSDYLSNSSLARIRQRGNSSSRSSFFTRSQPVCSNTGYSERAVLCCGSKTSIREGFVRTAFLPHNTRGHALFDYFSSCIRSSRTVSRLPPLKRQHTGLSSPPECQVASARFAAAAACSSPLLYHAAATPQGPLTSCVTAGSVLLDTAAAAAPPPPVAAAAAASRGGSKKACLEASWNCSSRKALSSSQGECWLLPLAAAAAALPGRTTTVGFAAAAAAGSVGGLRGAPQGQLHYRCEGKRGHLLQQQQPPLQRRGGEKKTQKTSQYTTNSNPPPPVWGAQQQLLPDCENDAEAEWEEELEEWGGSDPLEEDGEYETPSNEVRDAEDEAEWVAEDVHADAFEQLRELERVRDKELLMSWAEWGKAVGRSVDDLKSLVRTAYGMSPPPVPATAAPVLATARDAAPPAGPVPAAAAPCAWGSAAAYVAADAAAADERMVEMAAGAGAAEAVTAADQVAETRFAVEMRSEDTGATGDGRSAGAARTASVTEAVKASAAEKVQGTPERSRDGYPEETAAEDGPIIQGGTQRREPQREAERLDTRGQSSRRLEAAGAAEVRVSNDRLIQQGIKRESAESVDHDYASEESLGDKSHINDKASAPERVGAFSAGGKLQQQQQKQIKKHQQQQDGRLPQVKEELLPGQQPFQQRLLQEQESHPEVQAMCIPPPMQKKEVSSRQIATEKDQTNTWEAVREQTHEGSGHSRSGRNSASASIRNSETSRSEHPSQTGQREEVKCNSSELQKGEHTSFTQGSGMSATNAKAEDTSCVVRLQCVPPAADAVRAGAAALHKEAFTTVSSGVETPAAAAAVCGGAVSPRVDAGPPPPARHVSRPLDRRKQQPQQLRMKLQVKGPASSGRKQQEKISRSREKKEREQEASAGVSRGHSTLASLLLSPEEYRELLSLSRVEAIHAALEGAANEEEVFIVPQEGEAETEEEKLEKCDYEDLLEQATPRAASVEEGGACTARCYGSGGPATATCILPRSGANERCLLRPPTVDEWAAAVTAGDVEELNRRLERGRALLERCLRRLQPLAQAAVQRFRATNKLAALLRQQLRDQGDYEAVKAYLARGTEEELELLLVALQGIRQGLRRHARTALRRSVRLRRAKQNHLLQQQHQQKLQQQQQAMQQQQQRHQKLQRQQQEMQQEQRETQRPKIEKDISKDSVLERSGTRSHESSSFEKLRGASTGDNKTGATDDTRVAEEEEEREGEEEEEEEEEIPLEPPPSVAYWMWMRTAMAEWEQQKRQVSQFPWRWWREAARGRKAAHILYQELGREPTQDEVAEKIGVPLDRWNDITLATKAAISTETELSGAGGLPGLKLGGGAAETGDRRDTVGDFLVSEDLGQEGEQASLREDLETHVLDLAAQALDSSEYRMVEKLLAVSHSSGVHAGGPRREEGGPASERVVSGEEEREEVCQSEGNGQTDGDETRNHSLQLQNDGRAHSETAKVPNNIKRTRVDQQTRRRRQGAQKSRGEKNAEQQQKGVGGEKQKIQMKEVVDEEKSFQQQQRKELQCDRQNGSDMKQKRTLDHNEEDFRNIRRVLVDFMNDKVSARLQGVIEKMKEFEVKRILANLSPQEKADGLQNPEALEAIVQRKSAVLQLCLSANTMQGIEQ